MSKFISNSTMLPNAFVDEIMADLSDKALRIYLVIIRKTTGWQKEWDCISVSQFTEFTGIRDERTIRSGLKELIQLELVKSIQKTGRPTSFSLVYKDEIMPEPPASDVPPTSHAPPTSDVANPLHGMQGDPLHLVQGTKETNKRNNKRKKEKIKKENSLDDDLSLSALFDFKPESVGDELWTDFIRIRKKRKATQSARAIKGQLRELGLCEQNGISSKTAIERYLEESWKGLKFQWLINTGSKNARNRAFGNETASQKNARISQETTRQHEETVAQALADGSI